MAYTGRKDPINCQANQPDQRCEAAPEPSALSEIVACLLKYQARYHGAPHAARLWARADRALKRFGQCRDDRVEAIVQEFIYRGIAAQKQVDSIIEAHKQKAEDTPA